MLVYLDFHPSFYHQNVVNQKFTVDIEPNQTVDILKTMITMKYQDLDPNDFNLYLRGKKIKNQLTMQNLIQLNNNQSAFILEIRNR